MATDTEYRSIVIKMFNNKEVEQSFRIVERQGISDDNLGDLYWFVEDNVGEGWTCINDTDSALDLGDIWFKATGRKLAGQVGDHLRFA